MLAYNGGGKRGEQMLINYDDFVGPYRDTKWNYAVRAYWAYGEALQWTDHTGQPMPTWDYLHDKVKQAWRDAALEVEARFGYYEGENDDHA
jgi:hypothetical protein